MQDVLTEVMALFPGEFIHIGATSDQAGVEGQLRARKRRSKPRHFPRRPGESA
jgi:N-acetyl-beta-hexosaminidase